MAAGVRANDITRGAREIVRESIGSFNGVEPYPQAVRKFAVPRRGGEPGQGKKFILAA